MCSTNYYTQAPYTAQPITYHKGKVKRIKHTKRNEVPVFYRRKSFIERLESLFGFHT